MEWGKLNPQAFDQIFIKGFKEKKPFHWRVGLSNIFSELHWVSFQKNPTFSSKTLTELFCWRRLRKIL